MPSKRIPSHPGRILRFEYLEPLGISVAGFASHLGSDEEHIQALLREELPVTPRLAWLLGMATGTGPELWMDLQTNHDLARNRPKRTLAKLVG
ncbi:MAG: addiction module antidote protein, HigA family [Anaerolinea sp.]|nr:addiction module antidote protein, HigA family [Anaerolinea sp.]